MTAEHEVFTCTPTSLNSVVQDQTMPFIDTTTCCFSGHDCMTSLRQIRQIHHWHNAEPWTSVYFRYCCISLYNWKPLLHTDIIFVICSWVGDTANPYEEWNDSCSPWHTLPYGVRLKVIHSGGSHVLESIWLARLMLPRQQKTSTRCCWHELDIQQ